MRAKYEIPRLHTGTALARGIRAWWPIQGQSGLAVMDRTPGGQVNGTIENAGAPLDTGPSGNVFNLTTVIVRAKMTDPAQRTNITTGGFTLAARARIDFADNGYLICRNGSTSSAVQYGMQSSSGTDLQCRINNVSHNLGPGALSLGVWLALVITWDGANLRGYVNGLPTGTSELGGSLTTHENLNLGGRSSAADNSTMTAGVRSQIAEAAIWARGLTEGEVRTWSWNPTALFAPSGLTILDYGSLFTASGLSAAAKRRYRREQLLMAL